MTAIILIQPASYLQHGQAAYPANLSLGGETHEEPSTKTLLADAVDERTQVDLQLSNICT